MKKRERFWLVCDILFLLVLCFAVLFATMLLTTRTGGQAEVFAGYRVRLVPLLAAAAALGVYFVYLLRHSLRSLRDMVRRSGKDGDGR